MNGRTVILERIRRARRVHTPLDDAGQTPRGRPPAIDDPIARLRARAQALSSTVIGPLARRDVPAAVAKYLAGHGLGHAAVCWPELAPRDWRSAGMEVESRPAADGDLVGITGAFCAIAETGTLMLLSGPDTPAVTSLLPETHIALVPAGRIVSHMEDAWALLRAERGALPRAVNFISGPSRSADIEQTVTLGAHGPYRVLIVLEDNG